ncbi:hypothetical protein HD554DRAFT_2038637 [Boletus coccyginus]|nr:hypothetical protein HD554DRAFT_2038637 [Boletus coccyginus]
MSPDAMEPTTTKEDLYTVLKLEADGRNWVIFKNHLEWALTTHGVVDHLNGTATKPQSPGDGAKPDEIAAYEKSLAEWQKPEMWKTITIEYKLKTSLVQADLCAKFQNLSCPEKGDLRAHLVNSELVVRSLLLLESA